MKRPTQSFQMLKEIGLGGGLALLAFLLVERNDIIPLVVLLAIGAGIFYLIFSKGLLTKNFSSISLVTGSEVSFNDIEGQSSAIQELREALDFICNFKEAKQLGIRPLKGILLTGPPGTGKTMLAKAASAYTNAIFVVASGSEFIEMFAGVGAQRVRRLFQTAREKAKKAGKNNAIIFIDEIEILGGKRGKVSNHLEYDQTLNQLLVEMDGIKANDNVQVLLVAATNRIDMLDPALLRPGRFDRQVKVSLPDKEGRLEILRIHVKNKPLAKDVILENIARETFGFSGAHIESLANEAAILAMREGCHNIYHNHFNEAIDKIMIGEKLNRKASTEELKRAAIHESGHALVSEIIRPGSVSQLTIIPRGETLGYMRQTPEDDIYLYTKQYLENQIAIMLAGSIAEEELLGNRSTGSASDFEQVICLAQNIIRSGMSELGIVEIEALPQALRHKSISSIIREQENRVKLYISQSKTVIAKTVDLLLEQEKISGEEFRSLIRVKAA